MSFLSKKLGRTVSLPDHFYHLLVLGGFLPVVGAPVFAFFIGMILHPFLTSYTQLDAGLTYSSKKTASVCCYFAWVWTQYLTSFSQLEYLPFLLSFQLFQLH